MALTLNTYPVKMDKTASFNITTSLVEDTSHVNLRVRADIYVDGIIIATVEKPKGISDFNFDDILKSECVGLKIVRDTAQIITGIKSASNLITSWASYSGTYTTLTTAANVINSAICTVLSSLESNDMTLTAGKVYMFYTDEFTSLGNQPIASIYGTNQSQYFYGNKCMYIMPFTTGNYKIIFGQAASQNIYGKFYVNELTPNFNTVGRPFTFYRVNFTEIYEDGSGVTTPGDSLDTNVFQFIPVKGDELAFTEYIMHDSTSRFANKTLRNNVCKFYTNVPYELWLSAFSEYLYTELYYSVDGGAWDHSNRVEFIEGWSVIILNIGEFMNYVTSNARFQIKELGTGTALSEIITVYVDSSCNDARVILEYDGLVGGKEYLPFEGMKDIEFTTIRNYIAGSKKNRKPLSFTGINKQKLGTTFKDLYNADYLKSLLVSDNVKKLEALYAPATDVTVLTETVRISNSELFSNEIDIEYEY